MSTPTTQSDPETDDNLVALALLKGWVGEAQVAEAEQVCRKLKADGVGLSLFEVLAKKGYLSPAQIAELNKQCRQAQGALLIPGYALLGKLGQGAMGAVYRAHQKAMNRPVAIKILPPSLAKKPGFIERFQREARASARLNHPNVVAGIDVGEANGYHYFVMEYVEGTTLRQTLQTQGRLSEPEALKIGFKLATALEAIEKVGLVHRDIKPENIILAKDGVPKLCDLGLARLQADDSSLTQADAVLGTPLYMSPEQAQGKHDLDIRCDIYALGATLYHLVTGQPLFSGATSGAILAQHLTAEASHPQALDPRITDAFVSVLRKMLAKEPHYRYPRATELCEDLAALLSGHPPRHAGAPELFKSSLPEQFHPAKGAPVAPRSVGESTATGRRPVGGTSSFPPVTRGTTKGLRPIGARAEPRAPPEPQSNPAAKVVVAVVIFGLGILVFFLATLNAPSPTAVAGDKKSGAEGPVPPAPSVVISKTMPQPQPSLAPQPPPRREPEPVPVPLAIRPAEGGGFRDPASLPTAPAPVRFPTPANDDKSFALDRFKGLQTLPGTPPVERNGEAYVLKSNVRLVAPTNQELSCEFEFSLEAKLASESGLVLTLPRQTTLWLTQLNGLVIPLQAGQPNTSALAPDTWHRIQVKLADDRFEATLKNTAHAWSAAQMRSFGARNLSVQCFGPRESCVEIRNLKLVLGKQVPPLAVSATQPANNPPALALPEPERGAQKPRPGLPLYSYSFTREEDLLHWLQVEPGWTVSEEGLGCLKPSVNQRLEWALPLQGDVTVSYEGRTLGDLGLSFVDAAHPTQIYDRIVVGGQDGQKAGVLSPGKSPGKLIPLAIADGKLHKVVVVRGKASLTLKVDGQVVLSVPNEQTHNPSSYKLRLHLFEKPGVFNKLSIEPATAKP